jgi:hypothetical protein
MERAYLQTPMVERVQRDRFRDLVHSFEAEFDGELCEAYRSLIRQASTLLLKSEQMQEAVVRGEPVDSDALIRMASTAKRVLAAISAKRTPRLKAKVMAPLLFAGRPSIIRRVANLPRWQAGWLRSRDRSFPGSQKPAMSPTSTYPAEKS